MSLNGINAGYAATAATAIEKVQKADKATASSKESAYKSEAGATYETTVSASSKQTKNAALVAQLKADSEKRSAPLPVRSPVCSPTSAIPDTTCS